MKESKLKPCRECGNKGVVDSCLFEAQTEKEFVIYCSDGDCPNSTNWGSREDVISQWNQEVK